MAIKPLTVEDIKKAPIGLRLKLWKQYYDWLKETRKRDKRLDNNLKNKVYYFKKRRKERCLKE